MIKNGIIRQVLAERPYVTRDGKQRVSQSVKVEFPYTTMSGTPGFDAIICERHCDNTEQDRQKVYEHIDQERELTIYLGVREFDNPQKGKQYFQDARLAAIKTVN